MAGVMMPDDEGVEASTMSVPSMQGDGSAPVASSDHLNGPRAEGVAYNENPGVSGPHGDGFPAETDVGEANNPLKP